MIIGWLASNEAKALYFIARACRARGARDPVVDVACGNFGRDWTDAKTVLGKMHGSAASQGSTTQRRPDGNRRAFSRRGPNDLPMSQPSGASAQRRHIDDLWGPRKREAKAGGSKSSRAHADANVISGSEIAVGAGYLRSRLLGHRQIVINGIQPQSGSSPSFGTRLDEPRWALPLQKTRTGP